MVLATLLAIWPLNMQPMALCHGRAQRLQLMTSLRHFGKPVCTPSAYHQLRPHNSPASFAGLSAAPPSSGPSHRQQDVFRCYASQQLQTLDTESAAAAATAAVAPRAIQPGEVHVWWLLPSNVSGPVVLVWIQLNSCLCQLMLRVHVLGFSVESVGATCSKLECPAACRPAASWSCSAAASC
jgi:hypothetical protein